MWGETAAPLTAISDVIGGKVSLIGEHKEVQSIIHCFSTYRAAKSNYLPSVIINPPSVTTKNFIAKPGESSARPARPLKPHPPSSRAPPVLGVKGPRHAGVYLATERTEKTS